MEVEQEAQVGDLDQEALVQHDQEEEVAASMLQLGEAEAGDSDRSKEELAEYLNLTGRMDLDTVLQVSASRMASATPWEVLLSRARCLAIEDQVGLLDLLLSDVNLILSELRGLITACARPPPSGRSRKSNKDPEGDNSVFLDESMSLALGLAKGVWMGKDPDEVNYYHSMVSADTLFKRRSPEDDLAAEQEVDVKPEILPEVPKKVERRGRPRKRKPEVEDHEFNAVEKENDESDQVRPKRQRRLPKKLRDGAKNPEDKVREDNKPEEPEPEQVISDEKDAVLEKKSLVERKKDPNSQGKYYLCLKCGQKLCKAYGKQHEARCTGFFVRHPEYKKINGEYLCTVDNCDVGYTFPSIYGLRMHFHATHIREEEKYFSCEHCGEKFSFKTEKNKHVRTVHIKEHTCDICNRGFGSREKRDCHRRTHTGEKPFACNYCDYRAAKKFNLDMHLQAKHGDFGSNKNFLCAVCNKQFVTMGRVRRHMTLAHTDGKVHSMRNRKVRRVPLPPDIQRQLVEQHQEEPEQQVLVETVKDGEIHEIEGHQVHIVAGGEVEVQDEENQTFITVTDLSTAQ